MKSFKLFTVLFALLLIGVMQASAGYLEAEVEITSNTSASDSDSAYPTTPVSWTAECLTQVDYYGTANASVTVHDASITRVSLSCRTPDYFKSTNGSFTANGNYISATCNVSASGTTSCRAVARVECNW